MYFSILTGSPESHIPAMVASEPTTKLTKNGDTYTLTNTGIRTAEITFTNGGQFVEKINDKMTVSKYNSVIYGTTVFSAVLNAVRLNIMTLIPISYYYTI